MDRLISAERLKAHYSWWGDDPMRETFDQIVDQQPTVDPVKPGRWEYRPAYQGAEFGFYVCSSCGSPFWWNTSKYCPECGARMDGGADDERLH
jgi:rubrerythrin